MQNYTIMIDESQRQELLRVLKDRITCDPEGPLELWEDMLEDLPQAEKEYPGIVHGFCI